MNRKLISVLCVTILLGVLFISSYSRRIAMCYINADGSTSIAPKEVVDTYNYLNATKGSHVAEAYAADAFGTPAGPGYAMPGGHSNAYYGGDDLTSLYAGALPVSTPAPTPTPAAAITPAIAQKIQADLMNLVAANPAADPKALYLQALQLNGFTLDANGKVVPIAK